jgi:3-hydroxybutyrate dehydrogenase
MLHDRVALVTGSTSGIGLGIARALASQGAAVMLHGIEKPTAIARLRDELEAACGVTTDYCQADLTDPAAVERLVADTRSRLGGLDILVNNAGIQHPAPVESFPIERWDTILALNLSAAFHSIRLALPGMRERRYGRIINIASVHGLVASAEKSAYVAAKHGLVGLTRVVALETAGSGVTCNAVCPGWVLTPLVQKQIDARAERDSVDAEEAGRRLLAEKQPSRQFVSSEDLGALAVFLCSDAASQMTGTALPMDGGWTAQ